MTRDELRIKMALEMWWELCYDADNNSYWIDPDGNRHNHSPDLDHWFKRCVVELADKHYFLDHDQDRYGVWLLTTYDAPDAVGLDDDPTVAVCTAWLAVCAKGGA